MDKALRKHDWLQAARLALLKGGVADVRVERLARDLHVTKGSFYWHFKDREELLELLLWEWENELREIVPQLQGRKGEEALLLLVRWLVKRARLSEAGFVPSDAAMFTWASVSPEVARRVNRTEEERIRALKQIIGHPDRTELFYLVWLGFVARGQRVPGSRQRFPHIAQLMLSALLPAKRKKRKGERPKARF
jgi:AcrR family transcriptional regulator